MTRLKPEQMAAWRRDPVTRIVFKYLSDYRDYLKESWADGLELPENAQMIAQLYGDLNAMDATVINEFYREGDDDGGDEQPDEGSA